MKKWLLKIASLCMTGALGLSCGAVAYAGGGCESSAPFTERGIAVASAEENASSQFVLRDNPLYDWEGNNASISSMQPNAFHSWAGSVFSDFSGIDFAFAYKEGSFYVYYNIKDVIQITDQYNAMFQIRITLAGETFFFNVKYNGQRITELQRQGSGKEAVNLLELSGADSYAITSSTGWAGEIKLPVTLFEYASIQNGESYELEYVVLYIRFDWSNATDAFGSGTLESDGSYSPDKTIGTKYTFTADKTSADNKISSAALTLGKDITMNYYAAVKNENLANAKMRFTFNNEVTEVTGTPTNNSEVENEYVFSFTGIAPQLLGENIKAELMSGDTVLNTKDNFSVESYCKNLIASESSSAALKTLCADVLAYGAAAQTYKNYKTDALVKAANAGTPSAFEAIENSGFAFTDGEVEGYKLKSANLWFNNANKLCFKFTAASTENLVLKVTKDGAVKEYTSADFVSMGNNEYAVFTDEIYATEFDTEFKAELVKGEQTCGTVTYSVKAYVAHWQNSENTAMANLAKALYNYGKSAKAYQATQQN